MYFLVLFSITYNIYLINTAECHPVTTWVHAFDIIYTNRGQYTSKLYFWDTFCYKYTNHKVNKHRKIIILKAQRLDSGTFLSFSSY